MKAKVVHFEIPADDVERARKFYSSCFGSQVDFQPGTGYTLLKTVDVDERQLPKEPGAINGGMLKRLAPIESVVITLDVADIDASLQMVQQAGGRTVRGKQPVGSIGFAAYVEDSEGNVIGLWQTAR